MDKLKSELSLVQKILDTNESHEVLIDVPNALICEVVNAMKSALGQITHIKSEVPELRLELDIALRHTEEALKTLGSLEHSVCSKNKRQTLEWPNTLI